MAVKCIKEFEKTLIVDAYTRGTSIQYLVETSKRSRRTIIRVLAEAGIDPIKHRKPKPQPDLFSSKEEPKVSFWKKIINAIKRFVSL